VAKLEIGFEKPGLDLGLKHIYFETHNGERHDILFRYSHMKGIERDSIRDVDGKVDAYFDGCPVKIIDAHPNLWGVIQESFWYLRADFKGLIRNFLRRKKGERRKHLNQKKKGMKHYG